MIYFVGEQVSEVGGRPFDGKHEDGRESRGGSGWRLARILGETPETMHRKGRLFVNLLDHAGEWDSFRAGVKASMIQNEARHLVKGGPVFLKQPATIVMLGRRVARAFRVDVPFFCLFTDEFGVKYVSLPHPSGQCRVWNDPRKIEFAREALGRAGVIK